MAGQGQLQGGEGHSSGTATCSVSGAVCAAEVPSSACEAHLSWGSTGEHPPPQSFSKRLPVLSLVPETVLGARCWGERDCWVRGCAVRGCVGAQSIQCRAPRPAPPNRSMMLTEERSEINNGFYLTQYSQNIIVPTCKRSLKNLNEIRYILSFGPSL